MYPNNALFDIIFFCFILSHVVDMDYTLAQYNAPQYEMLAFDLVKERLVMLGYPSSVTDLQYDDEFPIRGLFVDRKYGNFLKVDTWGQILSCVHGRTKLSKEETQASYPSMMIHQDEIGKRFYLLDTLFALPMASLLSQMIDLLEATEGKMENGQGICGPNVSLTFNALFDDVQGAVDWVHQKGELKKVPSTCRCSALAHECSEL